MENLRVQTSGDNQVSEPVTSPTTGHKKIVWPIIVVIFLVILGIGGWWYYAQGQAWLLVSQSHWNWGQDNLQNYQQKTGLSILVQKSSQSTNDQSDPEMNATEALLGSIIDSRLQLDLSSDMEFFGADSEGTFQLSTDFGDNNDLILKTDIKKIDQDVYFRPYDIDNIEEISAGFITLPDDFGQNWVHFNIEGAPLTSEHTKLDGEQLLKINQAFDDFLEQCKTDKIFGSKDLHQGATIGSDNLKKIELIFDPDKAEYFVQNLSDFILKLYDITDSGSAIAREGIAVWPSEFTQYIQENPDKWQKMQDQLAKVHLVILINQSSKNIQGLEINLDRVEVDYSKSYATILSGVISYTIAEIEPRSVIAPQDTQTLEEFVSSLWNQGAGQPTMTTLKSTDTDGDGLPDDYETVIGTDPDKADTDGDGYPDKEEIFNGYNPAGAGTLKELGIDDTYYFQQTCMNTGGEWLDGSCQCPLGESIEFLPGFGCTILE